MPRKPVESAQTEYTKPKAIETKQTRSSRVSSKVDSSTNATREVDIEEEDIETSRNTIVKTKRSVESKKVVQKPDESTEVVVTHVSTTRVEISKEEVIGSKADKKVTQAVTESKNLLKPTAATLLTFVQQLKSENRENEASCTMIENKLLKTTGAKAEALVGAGYQGMGVMLFNQADPRALEAFDNAIAAYEVSEQALKLNKCAIFKVKTLGLLAQESPNAQGLLQQCISVLKNVARWVQGAKGDVDPKEIHELQISSAYEMAITHTELGMLKWTERKGSSSSNSSLSTLWKAAKWWSQLLKLQCGEKHIRTAFTSLIPIAEMFQVLDYTAQYIAILKLLTTITDAQCSVHALKCELAQAYYAVECPERAAAVLPSLKLACEHADVACADWRDRALVAQAACLCHPSNKNAKETREIVKAALETRIAVDPGRVKENFVGLAEAHLALAGMYNTIDLAEALHHAQLSERAWQVLFNKGEHSSSSSHSSSSNTSSSSSSPSTDAPTTTTSSHSSLLRLSKTLKRTNVWRCLKGFSSCLDLLATLYQRQGSVYHAQHVFTKGLELAAELGCENLSCRFLLRLAHLDCTRALLSKSESRLLEVRQRLPRPSSSSPSSSTTTKKASSSSSSSENLDPSVWDISHIPLSTVLVELQTGELRTREQPLQLRPALEYFGTAEQLLTRRAEETDLVRFEDALLAPSPATDISMQDQKVLAPWLGAVRRSQLACMLRKDYDLGLPSLRDPSISLLEDCLLTLRGLANSQPESELGATWLCLGRGRLLQHRIADLASVWEAKPIDNHVKGLLEEVKQDLLNAFEAVLGLPSPHPVAEIAKSLFELWGRLSPLRSAYLLDASVAISAKEHMRSKLLAESESKLNQIFGRQSSSEAEFEQFQRHVDMIPEHWGVCTVTLSGDSKPHLLVSHLRKGAECVVLRIPLSGSESKRDVLRTFADIMNRNKDNLASSQKVAESGSKDELKDWWAVRFALDSELQGLLQDMENSWFGAWKGVLLAPENAEDRRTQIDVLLQSLLSSLPPSFASSASYLRTLLVGVRSGTVERCQLESGLRWTFGKELSDGKIVGLAEKMIGEDMSNGAQKETEEEEDPDEAPSKARSTKAKRPATKKREPSTSKRATAKKDSAPAPSSSPRYPLILILGKELQHLPWESMPVLQSHTVCRIPSLAFLVAALSQLPSSCSSSISPSFSSSPPSLNVKKGYYILNPNQDLPATQSRFEGPLTAHTTWKGLVCCPPSPSQFVSALRDSDLFVYIGHAAGQQFLSLDELSRVKVRAAALLMGCSSGSMTYEGDYETMGVPLSYLLSGCPLVICNLWDVTDRDSDTLTTLLLQQCGVEFPEGSSADKKQSLSTWMTEARSQCKLRYLNGAAAVCYGLPLVIL